MSGARGGLPHCGTNDAAIASLPAAASFGQPSDTPEFGQKIFHRLAPVGNDEISGRTTRPPAATGTLIDSPSLRPETSCGCRVP